MILVPEILSKKGSEDERNFKSNDELKEHFISRIKERYNIDLTNDEYIDIHNKKGLCSSNTIVGQPVVWAKINFSKTFFIITIKGKKVLALYSKKRGRFITALPWHSLYDETRFVPGILKKNGLKEEAIRKYNEILSICCKEYVDLGDQYQNFLYYQKNCKYPKLMMAEQKGTLTIKSIYDTVLNELEGKIFEKQNKLKQIKENLIETL